MLRLARTLTLPEEAVTQTFAILGVRGSGKTHTAVVLAEEMIELTLPVCIIDPLGVWWGLRGRKNGKGTGGYRVLIFGGEKGDVPLGKESGAVVARLIVEQNLQCVLDLSDFRKGEQVRFMVAFAETLYRLKNKQKYRTPLHIIIDEADAFAPQRAQADQARMLGAVEDLQRRGRSRGIGTTLITQRPAVLNKNVLTQAQVLIAHQCPSPQDQKAIDDWISSNDTGGNRATFLETLASLPVGTAWVWSPAWLNIFKKVKIRDRKTFDSSRTPDFKSGGKGLVANMAKVDRRAIVEQLEETIEEIAKSDPAKLKRQVADQQDTIRKLNVRIDTAEKQIEKLKNQSAKVLQPFVPDTNTARNFQEFQEALDRAQEKLIKAMQVPRELLKRQPTRKPVPDVKSKHDKVNNARVKEMGQTPDTISKSMFRILRALYWLQDEDVTPSKVGFYSGYKARGGSFNNTMSKLRTAGYVSSWEITAMGIAILHSIGDVEAKPTGGELRSWMRPKLSKAENTLLDALIENYPARLTTYELADISGYSIGGAFNNALSRLRTLDCVRGTARDGGTQANPVMLDYRQ